VLAQVRMGRARQATEEDHQLFQAIAHRRTNRQVFERREVPPALLTTLSELAASPSAKCERGPAALNTFLPGLC
jgi:hypothetical protein